MNIRRQIVAPRSFAGMLAALLLFVSFAQASGPPPSQDQSRFEMGFLSKMIDHHFGAIKMAELCPGRTVHADLQSMCDSITTKQSAEIAKMQGWLKDWYGKSHTPELDAKTKSQIATLSKLKGAEFEKAFMTMLVGHHSLAITRSVGCLNEAYHAEMLNMCSMMIADQGDEIVTLRLWLITWYGVNDPDTARHHWASTNNLTQKNAHRAHSSSHS